MTTPAPTTPADSLELFGASYLRLTASLGNAQDAQWHKGATPRPVEDTTERATGAVNDPTWQAVVDPRRQALRAAVLRAEKALRDADEAMAEALAILDRSHTVSSGAAES